MPSKSPLATLAGNAGGILNVLREVDVRGIRAAAELPFALVFISKDEPLAEHIANLMYRGLRSAQLPRVRTSVAIPFDGREASTRASVVVILTNEQTDTTEELKLLRLLEQHKVPTVVAFIEDAAAPQTPLRAQWLAAQTVSLGLVGGVLDEPAAVQKLIKTIRRLKAIDDLALARHLPAFRESVSRSMIDDVAFSNAVYATGTGILETNPIVTLPLNAADLLVLTKNQGILAYKIALAMGMEADFRNIMPQLATVLGSGFIFRQVARQLIGLVPGLGIIPKVGVAFAGTYAVGEAVFRWCATGDKLSGDGLRSVYERALLRGKDIAQSLFKRRDPKQKIKRLGMRDEDR